jgi:hypothetical protein
MRITSISPNTLQKLIRKLLNMGMALLLKLRYTETAWLVAGVTTMKESFIRRCSRRSWKKGSCRAVAAKPRVASNAR